MIITTLPRIFLFQKNQQTIELTDPDPAMSPQAVQLFYANLYPELLNATLSNGSFKQDRLEFILTLSIGTKG